jgi:hypothetical protein
MLASSVWGRGDRHGDVFSAQPLVWLAMSMLNSAAADHHNAAADGELTGSSPGEDRNVVDGVHDALVRPETEIAGAAKAHADEHGIMVLAQFVELDVLAEALAASRP